MKQSLCKKTKNVRVFPEQNIINLFLSLFSSEEAETLARDLGMRLYRISVKDNLNIHGVFLHLAENYVSQVIQSNLFFHREFMGQANGHGGAFTRLGSANSDSSSSGVSCSSSDSSRSSSGSVRSSTIFYSNSLRNKLSRKKLQTLATNLQ